MMIYIGTIYDYTFDTEQTVKSITENSPKYFVDECRGTALPNVTVSIYSQINGKDILRYKYTFKLVYIKTITDNLDSDKNSPSYGQYVEKFFLYMVLLSLIFIIKTLLLELLVDGIQYKILRTRFLTIHNGFNNSTFLLN